MTTELAKVDQTPGAMMLANQMPDYLKTTDDAELAKQANALMSQYIMPARLKISQPTSKPPFSDQFAAGECAVMPLLLPIIKSKDDSFQFVPLFFYPEWITRNPIGTQITVAARSLDPKSKIAALSRNPETREQPYPADPTKKQRNLEVLHFIVQITKATNPELVGMHVALSFSGAEHKTGTAFSSLVKMRCRKDNGDSLPMFATQWQCKVGQRSNDKGKWYGFNILTPEDDSPFVQDEKLYNSFKPMNADYAKGYAESRIIIEDDTDIDESAATGQTVVDPAKSEF